MRIRRGLTSLALESRMAVDDRVCAIGLPLLRETTRFGLMAVAGLR